VGLEGEQKAARHRKKALVEYTGENLHLQGRLKLQYCWRGDS